MNTTPLHSYTDMDLLEACLCEMGSCVSLLEAAPPEYLILQQVVAHDTNSLIPAYQEFESIIQRMLSIHHSIETRMQEKLREERLSFRWRV